MNGVSVINSNSSRNDFERLDGKAVRISGTIITRGTNSSLLVGSGSNPLVVRIDSDNFAKRLRDNVPCYVGGQYLYQDAATIQGIFHWKRHGNCALSEIAKAIIKRDDEIYEF